MPLYIYTLIYRYSCILTMMHILTRSKGDTQCSFECIRNCTTADILLLFIQDIYVPGRPYNQIQILIRSISDVQVSFEYIEHSITAWRHVHFRTYTHKHTHTSRHAHILIQSIGDVQVSLEYVDNSITKNTPYTLLCRAPVPNTSYALDFEVCIYGYEGYICVYVYIHIYIHMYVHLYIHRCNGEDDCFYYHSWRNNVVIAFGTLSSFTYIYVYTHICTCVYVCVFIYVCIYVLLMLGCVWACVCVWERE